MSFICPTCQRHNPTHARFCACCGRALRRRGGGRAAWGAFLALVIVLGIALWAGDWWGCPGAWIGKAGEALRSRTSSRLVKQHVHLGREKTDAMFNLLAPADIKVLVGRHDHGVSITGTRREVAVLEDFAKLLVRHEGAGEHELRRSIEPLRSTWTKRETYKLSRHKAQCLFRILAFDDVPVLVHGRSSSIVVDATAADQEILAGLVEILRGHRLR